MQTVSLSLFRFTRPLARLTVLGEMAAARRPGGPLPQAEFVRLCGSGSGEGFTPRPNTAVWAILAAWPDAAAAHAGVADAALFRRWRGRAAEVWTAYLTATSARGAWGGRAPFRAEAAAATGPVAVLTRATLRPSRLLRFWAREPAISRMIGQNPDVVFKIGIGEVPWLQQVTFSIWPDAASMARFAHGDTAHGRAIRAVRDEGWFREELYARFAITGAEGRWGGACPLRDATQMKAIA